MGETEIEYELFNTELIAGEDCQAIPELFCFVKQMMDGAIMAMKSQPNGRHSISVRFRIAACLMLYAIEKVELAALNNATNKLLTMSDEDILCLYSKLIYFYHHQIEHDCVSVEMGADDEAM